MKNVPKPQCLVARWPLSPEERFWSCVDKDGPLLNQSDKCWIWLASRSKEGYGHFYYGGPQQAHRVSWRIAHGNVPPGKLVLHHCDNPPCVNPSHLYVGTDADNVKDQVARGRLRRARGVDAGLAKLTEGQVITIRRMYAAGKCSLPQLSHQFGIAVNAVWMIVRRLTWKHLSDESQGQVAPQERDRQKAALEKRAG